MTRSQWTKHLETKKDMGRLFLTKAQLPTKFWYWAVWEAIAINQLNMHTPCHRQPQKPPKQDQHNNTLWSYLRRIAQPTTKFGSHLGAWPISGNCILLHDGTKARSKFDSQEMLGIALGRSKGTNAGSMIIYNLKLENFSVSVDCFQDKCRVLDNSCIIFYGAMVFSVLVLCECVPKIH